MIVNLKDSMRVVIRKGSFRDKSHWLLVDMDIKLNAKRKNQLALRGNRTPGGSMATTQVTTTPLMLIT